MLTHCVYAIQPHTIHHTAPYSHTTASPRIHYRDQVEVLTLTCKSRAAEPWTNTTRKRHKKRSAQRGMNNKTLRSAASSNPADQHFSTPYAPYSSGSADSTLPSMSSRPQSVLAQQDQIIRQQDDNLDQLSSSVATLHRMGNEIRGELTQQSNLLGDLEHGVDQTSAALRSQQSRLKTLMRKNKKNCSWMIMIGACSTYHPRVPPATHAAVRARART